VVKVKVGQAQINAEALAGDELADAEYGVGCRGFLD